MTAGTPEGSGAEQPADFSPGAPDSWAHQPTEAPAREPWPGQESQQPPQPLPPPGVTPSSANDPFPQDRSPSSPPGPFSADQIPSGQFSPWQYPSAPFPAGQRGYDPYFYAPAQPRTNPFAITALVCGIVQFVLGLLVVLNILAAIPAIVFGSIALTQIRERGERGRGMAIAGLVLGILGVVYFALIIVLIAVGLGNTSSSGTS